MITITIVDEATGKKAVLTAEHAVVVASNDEGENTEVSVCTVGKSEMGSEELLDVAQGMMVPEPACGMMH